MAVTAFPYVAETWHDGSSERINHPYVDLTADPTSIDSLPEVQAFPPLKPVLAAVASCGLLRSTQCTHGEVLEEGNPLAIRHVIGAYLHVASLKESENSFVCHHVGTAVELVKRLRPPPAGRYLGFILTVEPYKSWRLMKGYYGLSVDFRGLGSTPLAASENSALAARILSEAISNLGNSVRQDGG